ncbi:hypothetical protein ACFLQU_06170 [Verrucomicrobiota bacterium]
MESVDVGRSDPEEEMRIDGTVRGGCGGAGKIPEEAYITRCLAAGERLQRGTLNITVHELHAILAELGEPHFVCDGNNPDLGNFRWWRIRLESPVLDESVPAFITRSVRSRASYLEIMSTAHFRTLGLKDGDEVSLTVIHDLDQIEKSAQP